MCYKLWKLELIGRSTMVYIHVSKSRSMVDEVVQVSICDLSHPKITLYAYVEQKGIRFSSIMHFSCPEVINGMSQGVVSLDKCPCESGSYSGVEAMGFIWSMRPEPNQRRGCRLLVRDAREIISITLEVYANHVNLPEFKLFQILCENSLDRTYLADNVSRVPVRHGRVRGTLFFPNDWRTCPGVVDLFGMGGGLMEFRAALLASKGFVTLALAYFGYDDLPDAYTTEDLTYFEEAVDFLLAHPRVSGSSVGVVGVSKGAEIATLMGALFGPKMGATIVLNGMAFAIDHDIDYKDVHLKAEGYKSVLAKGLGDSVLTPLGYAIGQYFQPSSLDVVIPVERGHGQFLLVTCGSDPSVPPNTPDLLADRLKSVGKSNFRVVRYHGAGHLLEPPFSPLCDSAYIKASNILVYYGGEPEAHNLAQIQFWQEMQQFLKSHLAPGIKLARL